MGKVVSRGGSGKDKSNAKEIAGMSETTFFIVIGFVVLFTICCASFLFAWTISMRKRRAATGSSRPMPKPKAPRRWEESSDDDEEERQGDAELAGSSANTSLREG